MNDFRAVIAILISVMSGYLMIDIFIHGFSIRLMIASVFGFLLVHVIWPASRSQHSAWYDCLQLIFDLPYRLIALTIRGLGKAVKSADDVGFDV